MSALGGSAVVAVLLSGCLASTYRIPPEELARQASLPPQERGRRVRVVQDLLVGGPSTDPDTANDVTYLVLRASASSSDSDEAAILVVATAAVVTVGLLAGEAIRYDGWVDVDPSSLVLLESPDRPRATALADLDPEAASSATDAYLDRGSAVGFEKVERAPLSRRGGTYAFHAGASTGVAPEGGLTLRPELGYFFTDRFALKLAYEATFGTELQHALLLHGQWMFAPYVGVWGQAGTLGIADDTGPIVGGGVLLELPATTRMAFEARAGASLVNLDGWRDTITSVTLGVAIY